MVLTENSTIYYFLMIVLSPVLGLVTNLVFFKKNLSLGSRTACVGTWIGLAGALSAWFTGLPFSEKNESWGFIANEISWLMATLILFISGIVHHFSLSYMAGDRNYRRYFMFLGLITVTTLLMVASDNIIVLIAFWAVSNLLLVLLMMHKVQWESARQSGVLAIKTFTLGLFCLCVGAGLLAYHAGSLSLHLITSNSENLAPSLRMLSLFFVTLAAFSQSGGWPFHRWLISSLNSPTPVSAFMHAGLINGGGLLLVRFASIFLYESFLLDIMFMFAVITLALGGIWKLLQSDIKRMLACSTMTQMGFMMMQCALGLFSAALAHLVWHGVFKAFLFLRSGSAILEKQYKGEEKVCTISGFLLSSLCGALGAAGFMFGSGISLTLSDTTAVLVFFSWIASTQLAYTLIQKKLSLFMALTASFFCLIAGILYGLTVDLIEIALAQLPLWQPRLLNFSHTVAITVIFFIWMGISLNFFSIYKGSRLWRLFYVRMLNASQPDPKTITSNRSGYKF